MAAAISRCTWLLLVLRWLDFCCVNSFRFILVKYSNWGLFNHKGELYPLFEKLYLLLISLFIITPTFNLIALLKNAENPKIYSNRWVINCFNQTEPDNSSIKYIIMIRTTEILSLIFYTLMYVSILYIVKGSASDRLLNYVLASYKPILSKWLLFYYLIILFEFSHCRCYDIQNMY